jgi:hypothetical protein
LPALSPLVELVLVFLPCSVEVAGATTVLSRSPCENQEQMKAARHSCPSTHAKYQEPNEKMMVGRYKAFLYNNSDYGTFDMCMNFFFHILIKLCSLKFTVLKGW